MASLWKEVRRLNNEAGGTSEETVYAIGTMMSGTDRSLEDSISGYTQIVIDRRGNRRFHGAFTGGFNAGYFNTVGLCIESVRSLLSIQSFTGSLT